MDRSLLSRKLIIDTVRFLLIGLGVSIGTMTTHDPGSGTFCFRWDAMKFGVSLVGATIGAVLVGTIRCWMSAHSHPDALR